MELSRTRAHKLLLNKISEQNSIFDRIRDRSRSPEIQTAFRSNSRNLEIASILDSINNEDYENRKKMRLQDYNLQKNVKYWHHHRLESLP